MNTRALDCRCTCSLQQPQRPRPSRPASCPQQRTGSIQQWQPREQQEQAGAWALLGARLNAGVLISAIVLSLTAPSAYALSPADEEGQSSVAEAASPFAGMSDSQKKKLDAADEVFKNSGTLKALLEKSDANRAKNKRDIQNKYCYRQAELGVGDCGGLRFIPGMTKNGKQVTPKWLEDALGVEQPEVEGQGKTLSDLLGPVEE